MLSELDIIVKKLKAIKSQALAELLKYTKHDLKEIMSDEDKEDYGILYFDGPSTGNEGSDGIVLSKNQGEIFKKVVKLAFPCTNNEAEYEALVTGLELAKEMKSSKLKICGDSNLIIRQLNGDFTIKEPNLVKYQE
ncbi:Ribonuclease H, partial [Parasponia andersonii]